MPSLVIVRHGQSQWNLENRFTGDVDVELSTKGKEEATRAGRLLKDYRFQHAFTSLLKRAIHTLEIILHENKFSVDDVPVEKSAALNERRYGDLQGMNKTDTALKYGDPQVLEWRRSFLIAPPNGESLKDTYERVVPYYQKNIEHGLINDNSLLIVAHGNSLRALMMYLEGFDEEQIANIDLATGVPKLYEFDRKLTLLTTKYIL